MDFETLHDILIATTDLDTCRQRVLHFFDRNLLVRYDTVTVEEALIINAAQPGFWDRIAAGEAANRQNLVRMITEMRQEGVERLDDLLNLEQGFRSKLFHTIAHLVDGFFGIDSFLYNLEEDSHWVTARLRTRIMAAPSGYWLARVTAVSTDSPERLHLLRSGQG